MSPSALGLEELLPLIFERFSAYQTLWGFYITVVLGIAGFVATAQKALESLPVKVMLTVGFLAFSHVNLLALQDVRAQRDHLAKVALSLPETQGSPSLKAVVEAGLPDPEKRVRVFHRGVDGLVVLTIWLLPWLRSRRKGRDGSSDSEM